MEWTSQQRSKSEEESWTFSQGEDDEENDEHDSKDCNDELKVKMTNDEQKMVSTPPDYEISDEEENQEDDDNVMGGEQEDEELYGDLNLNLDKRDAEMTDAQTNQETEEVHVTLTTEPLVVQQQSSSVSSNLVSKFINPSPDTDKERYSSFTPQNGNSEILLSTPANIHTIKAFMNRVGYQGVFNKVSAFYTKNLAQPWQTMFKVFNHWLTTRTSGHDQTKINILQLFHVVLNQTHVDYVALLWWDFMNNVFQKKEVIQLEEDYHSINDDVPLVSVNTTENVLVRGMLILDVLLTVEIIEMDDFKEYETVFMKVDVPMNQPQPVVSTQGTHRITLSTHRSPTVSASPLVTKKRKQIAGESNSLHKSLKITIKQKQIVKKDDNDSEDRIDPGRIDGYCLQSNYFNIQTFTSQEKNSVRYSHLPRALRKLCRREGFDSMKWKKEDDFHSHHDEHQDDDAPPKGEKRVKRSKKSKSLKSARGSSSKHSRKDSITYVSKQQSQHQEWDVWEEENVVDEDEVISEDVTPELMMNFRPLNKCSNIFEHARMELHEIFLSNLSRNAEEYAYHWNNRQCFHGKFSINFFLLEVWNSKEKKYILSLHKIHAEEFPEPNLEEKLNRWVQKEFKTFNEDARANDKPNSFSEADFKYLNKNNIEDLYNLCRSKEIDNRKVKLMNSLITFIKSCVIWERVHDFQLGIESYQMSKDEKRVMYLEEIVKFCDATLEKVLNEVKLIMFESKFLKKPPLLGELDQDIMKAYEREISKRLSHQQQMPRWESFVNGRPILPTMKHL
ncbi:hypothetical protein Tco_0798600 [Tanacetum coccineum]